MAIVSLHDQQITIYDAKGWTMRAPVSSGQQGRETPAGIFSVIQKEAEHYANIYDDAYMPYMQRLTWSGVAIHGGKLPGYPASHGCIRMPYEFAQKLFAETKTGMTVVVSDEEEFPDTVAHPGLVAPVNATGAPVSGPSLENGVAWQPEAAPEGPVTILLTNEDQRIRVFRN